MIFTTRFAARQFILDYFRAGEMAIKRTKSGAYRVVAKSVVKGVA